MADLTADRGAPVEQDVNAVEISPGSDRYGLVAALENQKTGGDEDEDESGPPPDDQEPDEEDEDLEGRGVPPEEPEEEGEPGAEMLDLGELGKFEPGEIEDALLAQQRLLEIESDYETLAGQRTELETIARDLQPAMSLQEMLGNPDIGNAVRGTLLNLMQQKPELAAAIQKGASGVFGQRQQAEVPDAVEKRLKALEDYKYSVDKDRHGSEIDGLFEGYENRFGANWPEGMKERMIRSALKVYGRNLNLQALRDHVDASIHRQNLRPEKKAGDQARIQAALEKAGPKVRVVKTGASRRSVLGRGDRIPDTTNMSDREFGKTFQRLIGR